MTYPRNYHFDRLPPETVPGVGGSGRWQGPTPPLPVLDMGPALDALAKGVGILNKLATIPPLDTERLNRAVRKLDEKIARLMRWQREIARVGERPISEVQARNRRERGPHWRRRALR
jgi:hypothetical protein